MKKIQKCKRSAYNQSQETKKKTIVEASDYYKPGSVCLNAADRPENMFICFPVPGDGELAHFQLDGYNLFVPIDSLGAFLPDVAAMARNLLFVE